MDKDTITRLAREAGGLDPTADLQGAFVITTEFVERFAALVAAHEREACAQVCIELGKEAELPGGIPPIHCSEEVKTLRDQAVAHYAAARYIRKRNDQRTI